jgi:hypothetical protein
MVYKRLIVCVGYSEFVIVHSDLFANNLSAQTNMSVDIQGSVALARFPSSHRFQGS